MHTYTFHVSGTHCTSCKIYIEETVRERGLAHSARVDLKRHTLEVETLSELKPEALAKELTAAVASHGYAVSVEAAVRSTSHNALWIALPIGLALLALFFLLQKSGLLNIGFGGSVTPLTSFAIGLVASVSSCLAIVGGLVLSLSAKISEDDISDTKTFVLFHVSRLVTFALLGGALGALGGAIGLSITASAVLGVVASAVMILLGLNLVGVISSSTITLPSGIFRSLRGVEHTTFAPLTLGFATFFLPCGFTQSMQVAALSSGSFLSGLTIMTAFALGTLPMLALLSFGSASFAHSRYAPVFFKSAGVVVVGLGLFALLSGLAVLGIMSPVIVL